MKLFLFFEVDSFILGWWLVSVNFDKRSYLIFSVDNIFTAQLKPIPYKKHNNERDSKEEDYE